MGSTLKLHKHAAQMGLENVEAIAAVEGIDMIAYGHSDLSARLGVHLQLEHPIFKAAVRRIAEACNAHGKLARGSAGTNQLAFWYA
ncbi:MAG TPA: aldolase/citrate lyase family protein [Acetobacteraceae bacterium]|nr:aldolase/citrate lyase family protein [Acetobacteraceae bacterium]